MGSPVPLADRLHRARCRVLVEGVVQGVGFRPFVYRLAKIHRLGGSARKGQHGAVIDAEGDREALARFLDDPWATAPSPAPLPRITTTSTAPAGPCAAL